MVAASFDSRCQADYRPASAAESILTPNLIPGFATNLASCNNSSGLQAVPTPFDFRWLPLRSLGDSLFDLNHSRMHLYDRADLPVNLRITIAGYWYRLDTASSSTDARYCCASCHLCCLFAGPWADQSSRSSCSCAPCEASTADSPLGSSCFGSLTAQLVSISGHLTDGLWLCCYRWGKSHRLSL